MEKASGPATSLSSSAHATKKLQHLRSAYETRAHSRELRIFFMNSAKNPEKWREVPPTTDKSLRLQREFEARTSSSSRAWLRVENVKDHVALWLNDRYLGEPEKTSSPRVFEIPNGTTRAILNVEFVEKHDLTMPSIELFHTGAIRIARHKILCAEANSEQAVFALHVELDANASTPAWVRTVVKDANDNVVIDDARRHTLALGKNRLRWNEAVDQPDLWHHHESGSGTHDPCALYTITTTVRVGDEDHVSDECTTVSGFRTITFIKNTFRINGEVQPSTFVTSEGSLSVPGSNSILRLTCVEDAQTYARADAEGIPICQRLPDDLDQARQVIDALAHHPSIVAWSCSSPNKRTWRPRGNTLRHIVTRADGTRPLLNE